MCLPTIQTPLTRSERIQILDLALKNLALISMSERTPAMLDTVLRRFETFVLCGTQGHQTQTLPVAPAVLPSDPCFTHVMTTTRSPNTCTAPNHNPFSY